MKCTRMTSAAQLLPACRPLPLKASRLPLLSCSFFLALCCLQACVVKGSAPVFDSKLYVAKTQCFLAILLAFLLSANLMTL